MRVIIFTHVIQLLLINSFAFTTEEQKESYIKVTAHNVGQGNCMTAELYSPNYERPIYLLMDAGSSAFKKELYCQKYFLEKKQRLEIEKASSASEEENYEINSPLRKPTSVSVPQSVIRTATPGESKALKAISNNFDKDIKNEMIKEIRNSLGMKAHNDNIIIRTFFISHPDSDHYNLAPEIFHNRKDKILNIILGGLPYNYSDLFTKWLQKQIDDKKTKIYFPALTIKQPINSINEILQECKYLKGVMHSDLYAPRMFSNPQTGWEPKQHLENFEQALPFDDYIKTYILSINPTHFDDNGKMARSSYGDDDNSDSLVIKLQVGEHSVILTGDATELTTGRILRNYNNNLDFLKSTIITSDHHGSKTHGSNNSQWIKATSPQHIIFSCGIMHGHPSLYAYENSKQSSRLVITDPHEIWVWENSEKKKAGEEEETFTKGRKVRVHTTYQSLFSTFSNGTLTFMLPEVGEVSIESQILDFDLQKPGPKKQYKTLPAREKNDYQDEEKKLEINIDENEFEELEKFTLENRETSLNKKELELTKKSLFSPESSDKPSEKKIIKEKAKEQKEESIQPSIEVDKKKTPFQTKIKIDNQTIPLKTTQKGESKIRLHKSSLEKKESESQIKKEFDVKKEEFIEMKPISSKSSKKSQELRKMASSESKTSSKPKKTQGTKRKLNERDNVGEETISKEKSYKKPKIGELITKNNSSKTDLLVTKEKKQLKKEQEESSEKSKKEKIKK